MFKKIRTHRVPDVKTKKISDSKSSTAPQNPGPKQSRLRCFCRFLAKKKSPITIKTMGFSVAMLVLPGGYGSLWDFWSVGIIILHLSVSLSICLCNQSIHHLVCQFVCLSVHPSLHRCTTCMHLHAPQYTYITYLRLHIVQENPNENMLFITPPS